jgi:hypothetical protein
MPGSGKSSKGKGEETKPAFSKCATACLQAVLIAMTMAENDSLGNQRLNTYLGTALLAGKQWHHSSFGRQSGRACIATAAKINARWIVSLTESV